MLRFLTDEDFDGRLTSALLSRVPRLDLLRVQDVGLTHTPDPDILSLAAAQGRIVLTHDRNTMTGFASTRVNAGQPMPGLFVVDRQTPLGRILNDLEAMAGASQMEEWQDKIIFVPLCSTLAIFGRQRESKTWGKWVFWNFATPVVPRGFSKTPR
jgi:hypothetical protein